MRILVQGIPAVAGADGVWRAGRKWPAGSPVVVEVLKTEKGEDPPMVDSGAKNADGSPRMMPDPHRIGRTSFEALKADPRIRILQDGETQTVLNQAAVDAAKARAADLAGKLAEAEAELAGAKAELDEAKAALQVGMTEHQKLVAYVAELEGKLAALQKAPEQPPAGEAPANVQADPKAKAKAGK